MEKERYPMVLINSAGSPMLVSLAQDVSEYLFVGGILVEEWIL